MNNDEQCLQGRDPKRVEEDHRAVGKYLGWIAIAAFIATIFEFS
jgi:hypothetical protein